jgi:hypothetical protein
MNCIITPMCVLHVYTDIDCLIHDRNSRDQIQEDYASRSLSIILLLGFITLATSPRCLSLSGLELWLWMGSTSTLGAPTGKEHGGIQTFNSRLRFSSDLSQQSSCSNDSNRLLASRAFYRHLDKHKERRCNFGIDKTQKRKDASDLTISNTRRRLN